jgi:hypothetical protein
VIKIKEHVTNSAEMGIMVEYLNVTGRLSYVNE